MPEQPTEITPNVLREWALPGAGAGKYGRGQVLVVGGAARTPGAAMLSAVAALRVGAGRLTLAVARSVAPHVAVSLPESGVEPLDEDGDGHIAVGALEGLADEVRSADAVLLGPGLDEPDGTRDLVQGLPDVVGPDARVVLDAFALGVARDVTERVRRLGGRLVMTARREQVVSPSGQRYDWTSCLITSTPSYAFRYGYLEERSILPAPRGFWPAFWTWQARGVERHTETDVYEFYSDNHRRLYGTQFSGARGRCEWRPPFDPTAGWHTYGVAIEASGTTWYADGKQVCRTEATSDAMTTIISNLAVYAQIPPEPGTTSAVKRVDYIRAWTAS